MFAPAYIYTPRYEWGHMIMPDLSIQVSDTTKFTGFIQVGGKATEGTSRDAINAKISELDKADRKHAISGAWIATGVALAAFGAGAVAAAAMGALILVGVFCLGYGIPGVAAITLGACGLVGVLCVTAGAETLIIGSGIAFTCSTYSKIDKREAEKNKDWFETLQKIKGGEDYIDDEELKYLLELYQKQIENAEKVAGKKSDAAESFRLERELAIIAYVSGNKNLVKRLVTTPTFQYITTATNLSTHEPIMSLEKRNPTLHADAKQALAITTA